jgi:hypothetical protein
MSTKVIMSIQDAMDKMSQRITEIENKMNEQMEIERIIIRERIDELEKRIVNEMETIVKLNIDYNNGLQPAINASLEKIIADLKEELKLSNQT